MRYTSAEMMTIVAARRIKDGDRVFVGVGLPNLACNLARRLNAPNMQMIYESGVVGANPSRLPLSIGDPCLVTGAVCVCSMFEVFTFYLQKGLIDVGFLAAAQVDKYGNLNTTVIGEYHHPQVRLGGSGGACDIASLARQVLILLPHERRRLPERVDFITSPGFMSSRKERERLGLPGGGPAAVITDKGILEFDEEGEMVLVSIHPGVELEDVKANTGWDLKVSPQLTVTEPPTERELTVLRQEVDPEGIYFRR